MSHPFRKFSTFQVLPSSSPKNADIKSQIRFLVSCDYGSNNPSSLNVQSGEIVVQTIAANEVDDEMTEKVFVARLNGEEGLVPRSILERLNQGGSSPAPSPAILSPNRGPAPSPLMKGTSFKSSTTRTVSDFEAAILSEDLKGLPIDDPSNIVIGEIDPQSNRPTVKAATVERLIDLLVSEYCYPAFRSCFLVSFRFFLTPEDLLKSMRQHYKGKMKDDKEKKTYARIIGILKIWIETHGKSDFPPNSAVRASLESFITDELSSPQLKKLIEKLDKPAESQVQSKSSSSSITFPPLDKLHTWTPAQTKTFVEQLTCLFSEKYRAITLHDFFVFATSAETNPGGSISDMRKISSFLHDWIFWELVRKAKSEDLATTLEVIASIITQLFELHNYVAVKEILDVIYDPRVVQLTKSLSSLQPSTRSGLDKIRKTFTTDNNFQLYLTQLESFSPCIPWIDYHLFSIKSYDVEMKNMMGNLINFEKWMKIYQESQTMQQYQISYNTLASVDSFEAFLSEYTSPPQSRVVDWLGVILQQKEEESIMAEFIDRNIKMKAQIASLKVELGIFEPEAAPEPTVRTSTPREKQSEPSEHSEPREAKEEMTPMKSMALLSAPTSNENRRKISKQLAAQLEESKAVLQVIMASLDEERPEEALRRRMASLQLMFDQKNTSLQKAVDEAEEKIQKYEQQLKSQEQ